MSRGIGYARFRAGEAEKCSRGSRNFWACSGFRLRRLLPRGARRNRRADVRSARLLSELFRADPGSWAGLRFRFELGADALECGERFLIEKNEIDFLERRGAVE